MGPLMVAPIIPAVSDEKMAEVLEEPTGTVKWRTSEALNRLRAVLSDEVADHEYRRTSQPGPVS